MVTMTGQNIANKFRDFGEESQHREDLPSKRIDLDRCPLFEEIGRCDYEKGDCCTNGKYTHRTCYRLDGRRQE